MEFLSKNIEYLISHSNKARKDIALELSKNLSTVSNWSGGYAKPGLDDFVALARYFNVSADDLLFTDIELNKSRVHEPAADYKNDTHLEMLIESYEIRITAEKNLNAVLTQNNEQLKANYENLQSALKSNYIKDKSPKKIIIKKNQR